LKGKSDENRMNTGELMKVALKAGEILLVSGAEIYRVEDTITRICASYGFKCESFVLPTGIFIAINKEGHDAFTAFRRIRQRSVDLNRIDMVNTLSRRIEKEKLSYEACARELALVENKKDYSFSLRIAVSALAAFAFALLFRGSLQDGFAAFFIGMVVYIIKEIIASKVPFLFFELFVSGFVAGLLSVVAAGMFPGMSYYRIIIGSVMIFLPGVAITNSIKDILYGDIVASITRMGEALFSVTSLGAGVAVGISIALKWVRVI